MNAKRQAQEKKHPLDLICRQRCTRSRVRGLEEEGNPRHRVRVEHNRDTLLVHIAGEDGKAGRLSPSTGRRESGPLRSARASWTRLNPPMRTLSEQDQRPAVGVAHVVLETDRMEESTAFMRTIGMRPVFDGSKVSVYEMRGGTHLILLPKDKIIAGDATFDLMVDDLHATHRRLASLGLDPSPIEARPAVDHEVFTVREPAGHVITFFSSHVSGKPV